MRRRRASLIASIVIVVSLITFYSLVQSAIDARDIKPVVSDNPNAAVAIEVLEELDEKGRAPKTNYSRERFSPGWNTKQGCDVRNIILNRDLQNVKLNDKCQVVSGLLQDPYTGHEVQFKRGAGTSSAIQIDHVVALSNAWQTGAQKLTYDERNKLANDPLELIAVDGPANQKKSDGDAATWLPSNKAYRCSYIARQITVKQKYDLWVTPPEKKAMQRILKTCPDQRLATQ